MRRFVTRTLPVIAPVIILALLTALVANEHVLLVGPPGTGKSHLAIALGVEAVKAGRSVYFCTLADLLGQLARAEREGRLAERIRFFSRPALLIVDDQIAVLQADLVEVLAVETGQAEAVEPVETGEQPAGCRRRRSR